MMQPVLACELVGRELRPGPFAPAMHGDQRPDASTTPNGQHRCHRDHADNRARVNSDAGR